jgi:hypothetical protein
VGSDEPFVAGVIRVVLGAQEDDPRRIQTAALRRLYFEAFTLVTADLRERVTKGPESESPRKLPNPERLVRRNRIVQDLNGLQLEGPLEPSNGLVDQVVTMVEEGLVKYIPWSECCTREQELANIKKDKSWKPGSDGLIRELTVDHAFEADISSDLRLMQALQRRGIALDLGGAMSYRKHDELVKLLVREHQREPPRGFSSLTYEQLERADREIFRRMAEVCRAGIQPDQTGKLPMDAALEGIMNESTVRMLLQPLAEAGAAAKMMSKLPPPPPAPHTPLAVGSAGLSKTVAPPGAPQKVKKVKKIRAPKALRGSTKDEQGKPICFAYNTQGQGCTRADCTREHKCMACFKKHPQYSSKCAVP